MGWGLWIFSSISLAITIGRTDLDVLSTPGSSERLSDEGPSRYLDSHSGHPSGWKKGFPEAEWKGLAWSECGGRAQPQPSCSDKRPTAQQTESEQPGWETEIWQRSLYPDGGVFSQSQWSCDVSEGPAGVAGVSQQLHSDSGIVNMPLMMSYFTHDYWHVFTVWLCNPVCRSGGVRTGYSPPGCWSSPQLLLNLRSPWR